MPELGFTSGLFRLGIAQYAPIFPNEAVAVAELK